MVFDIFVNLEMHAGINIFGSKFWLDGVPVCIIVTLINLIFIFNKKNIETYACEFETWNKKRRVTALAVIITVIISILIVTVWSFYCWEKAKK
ncbi:hypothetical protein CKA38_04605 [Ereboglobus luteus]|uniref:Uncharacterized protein n=1 Tax=Ereboglobus luteus TaxID=1796921 RepID=A0A2U8E1B5_9BACT|nr:hypothetical protein CKA38_04605 [Ereboglobus luteus]